MPTQDDYDNLATLVDTYANAQVWYVNALEVLSPLRWHLNELIQDMESHNRYAKIADQPLLPECKIAAAKEANNKVDEYFSSSKRPQRETGLKDSAGKMVYARDILEFDGYPCIDASDDCDLNREFVPSGKGVNYRYTVEWCDEEFMWTCPCWCVSDRVRGAACGMALFDMKGRPGLRVVGNMDDNPELLEKPDE